MVGQTTLWMAKPMIYIPRRSDNAILAFVSVGETAPWRTQLFGPFLTEFELDVNMMALADHIRHGIEGYMVTLSELGLTRN